MKTVYAFAADGAYLGPVQLDESDISPLEPGVYLIPGSCTDLQPPEAPSGSHARWTGSAWEVVSDPEPPADPEPETPPVPSVVTPRQARLALLAIGRLADVNAAIAALPSPQKEAAQIEWEYATEVRRDSALVQLLGPALGLDLDAIFTAASAID